MIKLIRGIPELPKDSILSEIFEYTRKKSHAPDQVIFWSIFSFCGAAINDKIYFNFAGKNIFPNFPLLIIAGSGIGKSSSINIIEKIFRDSLPYIIPENVTSEALFKNMAEKGTVNQRTTSAFWIVSEMADTFGNKDYQKGIVPKITRLLDNPRNMTVSRAGNKDDIVIVNTALLHCIFASTFPWFIGYGEEGTVTGGFMPRLNVIKCEDDPRFTPFPIQDREHEIYLRDKLKKELLEIKQGIQELTPELEEIRFEFHKDLLDTDDEVKRNYIARQFESFARIYMILTIFLRKFHTPTEVILLAKNCSKWLLNNNLSLYRSIKMRNILKTTDKKRISIDKKLRNSIGITVTYNDIQKTCRVKTDQLEPLLKFYQEHSLITWTGQKGVNGKITAISDPAEFWESFLSEDKNVQETEDTQVLHS